MTGNRREKAKVRKSNQEGNKVKGSSEIKKDEAKEEAIRSNS